MKLLKNVHLKILAIISSLILWFFVVGVENYVFQTTFDTPVKVVNLGQNVSIANEIGRVKIKYKASEKVSSLNINEFETYIDASNLSEGAYQLEVNTLSKNPKITVVAVEPAQIPLNLEAITSKEIKLKLEVSGKPAGDYELGDYKLSQDKVKVSGAASVLKKISDLVLKVSLDGSEKADFSRKITLESQPEWNLADKTVTFGPVVIQADIKIRRSAVKNEFNLNEVIKNATDTGNLGENNPESKRKTLMVPIVKTGEYSSSIMEILPQNLLVTVEGSETDLENIKGEDLKLLMKTELIQKGQFKVSKSDIVLPEDKSLTIVEFSPANITVKF